MNAINVVSSEKRCIEAANESSRNGLIRELREMQAEQERETSADSPGWSGTWYRCTSSWSGHSGAALSGSASHFGAGRPPSA